MNYIIHFKILICSQFCVIIKKRFYWRNKDHGLESRNREKRFVNENVFASATFVFLKMEMRLCIEYLIKKY